MNYEEFIHVITDEMAVLLGEAYSVRLEHQVKNNNVTRDVLVILAEEQTVSPVIDLEPFFREYCEGQPVVDILTEIHRIYRDGCQVNLDVDGLEDWAGVRSRIGARLICAQTNENLLAHCPHRRFLDLALIYDINIDDGGLLKGSAVVNYENMSGWNVSEEDLYQQSRENLPRLLPACIFSMDELMKELLFRETAPNLLDPEYTGWNQWKGEEQAMYVITNSEKYHGAVAVFYEGVLDRFMDRMGWRKIYLIPSSVHEMILLPIKPESREHHLLTLIREVNEEYVAEADILTDSLYVYDRHTHVLTRVTTEQEEQPRMYGVTIL